MTRPSALLRHCLLIAAVTFGPAAAAQEIEFDEAELYFELNDTDGDLGIHALWDGETWEVAGIETPDDRLLFRLQVDGELKSQGMTELFFESDEPTFDELPPEEFFERFPEGIYEIIGRTVEGDKLESDVVVSHVMPAPAGNVFVNDEPAAANCDVALPTVSDPVVIRWDPVLESHPEIGAEGDPDVETYIFVVESDNVEMQVFLPPSVTEFPVPSEILALEDELKFEILARSATYNQTGVESCFLVE